MVAGRHQDEIDVKEKDVELKMKRTAGEPKKTGGLELVFLLLLLACIYHSSSSSSSSTTTFFSAFSKRLDVGQWSDRCTSLSLSLIDVCRPSRLLERAPLFLALSITVAFIIDSGAHWFTVSVQ